MSEVRLEGITKVFGDLTALDDLTLSIADGEFFVLLGPTGAGKTTTLRVVAGLERQESGDVRFDGEVVNEVPPADRDTAFVFQQYSLYPGMSVYENLAFPLKSPLRRLSKSDIDRRIAEAAEMLHIGHLLTRKTARLSGGEMQRVSIGRAIVREPRIFLMDEPLSNLDAKLRESLRIELKHLQKTQGITTLFVTHDQIEALTMADRLAVVHEGRIVQIGTPEDIYDRPVTTYVAQLVGTPRINLLEAVRSDGVLKVVGSGMEIALPAGRELPERLLLGVRPEDVIVRPGGAYRGEVVLTEPLGVETIVHLRSGDRVLLSTISGIARLDLGEEVGFDVDDERLHLFSTDGLGIGGGSEVIFGVNTWVWFSPTTSARFAGVVPKVREMGFDSIEFGLEDEGALDYREAAAVLEEHDCGVSVAAVITPERDLLHDDPEIRRRARGYLEHCIEACARLGATNLVGPIYAAVGRVWRDTPAERLRRLELLTEQLRPLSEQAADRGVTLCIEPLNRFETSFVNTAEQVCEIVAMVDHPACGVLLDTFHMGIEEKSPGDAVRRCGPHLKHLHACGNDRGAPGNDHLPWREIADALREIRYRGPVVIESFTPEVTSIARAASVWRSFEPSQDGLARDGLAFLRRLLA